MTANVETAAPAGKKHWTAETLGQVQTQVEKVWADTLTQMQAVVPRVQGAEKEVRELVRRLEADGRKHLETLREQLKDGVIGRLKGQDLLEQGKGLFDQGAKLGEEAIEKLGLVTSGDLTGIKDELDKLAKKLETVRKKVNVVASKKDVEELDKRLAALEAKVQQ